MTTQDDPRAQPALGPAQPQPAPSAPALATQEPAEGDPGEQDMRSFYRQHITPSAEQAARSAAFQAGAPPRATSFQEQELLHSLRRSITATAGVDPNRRAAIQKLARDRGLDPSLVEKSLIDAEPGRAVPLEVDWRKLIQDSPRTSQWLTDPKNAALTRDDIPALAGIERSLQPLNTKLGFFGSVSNAAMTGKEGLSAATWHLAAIYGVVPPEVAAVQAAAANKRQQTRAARKPESALEFDKAMADEGKDTNAAWQDVLARARMIGDGDVLQGLGELPLAAGLFSAQMLDQILAAVSHPVGLGYSTVEQAANSLPALALGTAGGAAGTAVAPGIGSAVGAYTGAFAGEYAVEVGSWVNEAIGAKGLDTTDPEQILAAYRDTKWMAETKAAAERKGVGTAAVDALFEMFAGGATAKSIEGSVGRGMLQRGLAAGKAALGEVPVQAVGETAGELSGQLLAAKGDVSKLDVGEGLLEGISSAGQSVGEVGGGLVRRRVWQHLGRPGVARLQKAFQAGADAKASTAAVEAIAKTKLATRDPAAIDTLVRFAAGDGDVTDVQVGLDDWDAYWKAQGKSPADANEEFIVSGGSGYAESQQTGTVSIPYADWLSKFGPTEHMAGLMPYARVRPDGVTLGEADEILQQVPAEMRAADQAARNGRTLFQEQQGLSQEATALDTEIGALQGNVLPEEDRAALSQTVDEMHAAVPALGELDDAQVRELAGQFTESAEGLAAGGVDDPTLLMQRVAPALAAAGADLSKIDVPGITQQLVARAPTIAGDLTRLSEARQRLAVATQEEARLPQAVARRSQIAERQADIREALVSAPAELAALKAQFTTDLIAAGRSKKDAALLAGFHTDFFRVLNANYGYRVGSLAERFPLTISGPGQRTERAAAAAPVEPAPVVEGGQVPVVPEESRPLAPQTAVPAAPVELPDAEDETPPAAVSSTPLAPAPVKPELVEQAYEVNEEDAKKIAQMLESIRRVQAARGGGGYQDAASWINDLLLEQKFPIDEILAGVLEAEKLGQDPTGSDDLFSLGEYLDAVEKEQQQAQEAAAAAPKPAAEPLHAEGWDRIHPRSREAFEAAWKGREVGPMANLLGPGNKVLRAEFTLRTGLPIKAKKTPYGTVKAWLAQPAGAGETKGAVPETTAPKAETAPARFEATAEWQRLPEGAITQPGLDYRLNLTTGAREARLLPGTKPVERTSAPRPQRPSTAVPYVHTSAAQDANARSIDVAVAGAQQLSDALQQRILGGEPLTWQELGRVADANFGGSLAQGTYSAQDLANATEFALNRAITQASAWPDSIEGQIALLTKWSGVLPTQTRRSDEKVAFQQFSTPAEYAAVAAWLANLNAQDTVLEPSAGTGTLAVLARRAGAQVVVNEIDAKRAALLRAQGFEHVLQEDAEQLHNIVGGSLSPTAVVMNPPFSASGNRGITKDLMTGARHVEQALRLLAPGGRLVAIVGRGMTLDAPTFQGWWAKVSKGYTVLANVGVSGDVYRRQGTAFGTRVLVIDKTGPTQAAPMTGEVESVSDLASLLTGVRDARPAVERPSEPAGGAAPAGDEGARAQPLGSADLAPGVGGSAAQPAGPAAGGGGADRAADQRPVAPGDGQPRRARRSGPGAGAPVEGAGGAAGPEQAVPGAGGPGDGGAPAQPDGAVAGGLPAAGDQAGPAQPVADQPGPSEEPGAVATIDAQAQKDQDAAGVYESYKPQVNPLPGARPHPTPLVQSAAMSSVQFPALKYTPTLDKTAVANLSDAQVETVAYAGQAHDQMLGDGTTRRGFFIGDGTGVGKGREIAGVILDNFAQGRRKAVWVSKNKKLYEDAVRDWSALGADPGALFDLGRSKPDGKVPAAEGVMFVTYGALRSGANFLPDGKMQVGKGGKARLDQIKSWLPADFDGVIAFDESHLMGSALSSKGSRGVVLPSAIASAGLHLQRSFPAARVLYVSATGATEVSNLAYAERLGAWGVGTAFANAPEFVAKIASGGLANMEIVARDLKQMGLYTARGLSMAGVKYERLEHALTPEQTAIYDRLADAWQVVLQNVMRALGPEITNAGPHAKSRALSQFWSTNQRFFNQILTSMQMPSLLASVQDDLASGRSVVMQITNHYAARLERALAEQADDADEDDLDLDISPKDDLIDLVKRAFPTEQWEEFVDEEGNESKRMVQDAAGNPVENRQAAALRDALIADLQDIKVPLGPVDLIMQELGPDAVAEVTGRSKRVVFKEGRQVVETRSPDSANRAEIKGFQDGKKRVLVFSMAGGTGASYHADLGAKNQELRRHYVVQPGWIADAAIQGFGRTMRTNQRQAPEYVLVSTDLPGHKRFVSSIARRIEQLGALTKGQRQAGASVFTERDNLEGPYGSPAVRALVNDIANDQVEGFTRQSLTVELGLHNLFDKNGKMAEANIPRVTQFLNRMLATSPTRQRQWFEAFTSRMDHLVEAAIARGEFDTGMQTLRAKSVRLDADTLVREDPETKAQTRMLQLRATHDRPRLDWANVSRRYKTDEFYVNLKSGRIWAAGEARNSTDSEGRVEAVRPLYGPGGRGQLLASYFLPDPRGHATSTLWRPVRDAAEAQALWEADYAATPTTREETIHLLTGMLLPLWDRLPDRGDVYRITLDDATRVIGRAIPESQVDGTLERLGVGKTKIELTPAQVGEAVLAGKQVTLSNGWVLRKVRVANEARIELEGPTFYNDRTLNAAGVFTETHSTGGRRRYVPTGEGMETALEAVLKGQDIVRAEMPRTLYQSMGPAEWPAGWWWKGGALFDAAAEGGHDKFARTRPDLFGEHPLGINAADEGVKAGGIRLSYLSRYGALNVEFDSRAGASLRQIQDAVAALPEATQRGVQRVTVEDVARREQQQPHATVSMDELLLAKRSADLFKNAVLGQDDIDAPGGPPVRRGSINIPEPGARREFNIALLAKANRSTFIHEMGHYWFEVIGDLAQEAGAPPQLQEDFRTALAHIGATDRTQVTDEQLEVWARSFEAYLYEGQAPSIELRRLFATFAAWLRRVYGSADELNVKLTDDVRGVMDRLVATHDEIEAARAQWGTDLRPALPDTAGMSEADRQQYADAQQQANQGADDALRTEFMRDLTRENRRLFVERVDEAKALLRPALEQRKDYIALSILKTGKMPDGSDAPEGLQQVKLNRAEVEAAYKDRPALVGAMKRLNLLSEDGASPRAVAEMLGFPSADEMLVSLATAPPKEQLLTALAKRKVAKEHPDLLHTPKARAAAAAGAVMANPGRAEMLRLEHKQLLRRLKDTNRGRAALLRKQLREDLPTQDQLRQQAKALLASRPLIDLRPQAYLAALRRENIIASERAAAGDNPGAAKAIERQLLNLELYWQAKATVENAEKQAAYARLLLRPKTQKALGAAGPEFRGAVNEILDRYNFAKLSRKQIGQKAYIAEWIKKREDEGLPVLIAEDVRKDVKRRPWQTLTAAQLKGVTEALQQIEHTARQADYAASIDRKETTKTLGGRLAVQVEQSKPKAVTQGLERPRGFRCVVQEARDGFAELQKIAELARRMDLYQDGGLMVRSVIRPLNRAADLFSVRMAETAARYGKLQDLFTGKEWGQMLVPQYIAGLGESLSKVGAIAVALNWGNPQGRQRVLTGRNWNAEQVRAILSTLTERELQYVQGVWDLLESFWPEIAAKQERLVGVAPLKVEALPFMVKTADGKTVTMRGGYYTLKYDDNKAIQQSIEDMAKMIQRGAVTRAQTRDGHTKARLDFVDRPVRLDLHVIDEHLTQVLMDLTHHEALMDVARILRQDDLTKAIVKHYGNGVRAQFDTTLRDIAAGHSGLQTITDRWVGRLRYGSTVAILGWKATTSIINLTGLTQSAVRVGPVRMVKALAQFYGDPRRMAAVVQAVWQESEFMRTRAATYQQVLNEIRQRIDKPDQKAWVAGYFWLLERTQMMVDMPTWIAAKEKALDELPADMHAEAREREAIARADQAVIDSQGSGHIKDLANIQRGSAFKKLFTTFYFYSSTTLQRSHETLTRGRQAVRERDALQVARSLVDAVLLFSVPAVATVAVSALLRGGGAPGEDDDRGFGRKVLDKHLSFLLGLFPYLRELEGAAEGFFDYEGPAGAMILPETIETWKQVSEGEVDWGLVKHANLVGGILLQYPADQINRTLEGAAALWQGKTHNPGALLIGPGQKPRHRGRHSERRRGDDG